MAAGAFVAPPAVAQAPLTVGVVGGGILGASIALHLAAAGAKVTLFDKVGPAAGATGKSFAWINAYSTNPHYRALRLKSMAAWRDLDARYSLGVSWGGCIHWAESVADAERLKAEMAEFEQTGYPARTLAADELAGLAPGLDLGPFRAAAINPSDAHIDPVAVTRELLQQARRLGAELVYPCEVIDLDLAGTRLETVRTSRGDHRLDRLVIAGGVDTPALAGKAGFAPPLKHAPGILLHTTRIEPVLQQVVESPQMYFKQHRDGRIVGNDASYAPDIPAHAAILKRPQPMSKELRAMHGERILARVRQKLAGTEAAAYDHLTLGYRPMPEDGLPIAGFSPGSTDVYVAVMHSGVTLAPIMGRYVAHEILSDEHIDELAPYRPDRFLA